MNINKLKPGTKLIWVVPANNSGNNEPERHDPVTVGNKKPTLKHLVWLQFSPNKGWWTTGEQEQLREPTEKELTSLTWPEPQK
jgi:hypothetical protein